MKILLKHGCSCSPVKVHPKTWERANASIKEPWYIWYRFFDPQFKEKNPYGYLVKFRDKINEYNTLKERQDACRALIENEMVMLQKLEYNPITGTSIPPEEKDYEIHPETSLVDALQQAIKLVKGVPEYILNLKSVVKFFSKAAEQLRYHYLPVSEVRRRHLKAILEQCGRDKKEFTAATFNRYHDHMSALFTQLVECEAIEHNPFYDIRKMKKTTKKKELLTPEERVLIDEHLRKNNFTFWRFVHIFFSSGARIPEIMNVRKEDVSLSRQTVKYTIKKGPVIREEERPIKTIVLHLWEQLVTVAAPGEFLFSKDLQPGPKAIRHDQIKRRWAHWVQGEEYGLGVKKTIYSLKHLNTDEMDEMFGAAIPAALNQHDEEMVTTVYATGHKSRKNEVIKRAPNGFVPTLEASKT